MKKPRAAPAKKKEKVEEAAATKKVVWVKPLGMAPRARVSSRRGPMMIEREARGFSVGELAAASMPFGVALKWKVPLDSRRRTVLDANSEALTKWFTSAKKEEKKVEPEAEEAPKKRAPRKKKSE